MKKGTQYLLILCGGVIAVVIITLSFVYGLKSSENNANKSSDQEFMFVNTDCGSVEGKRFQIKTDTGEMGNVLTFKGIPYAEPPVNNLRWKPSILLSKTKFNCIPTPLRYSDKRIMCKQPGSPLSADTSWKESTEDCLILNIRTPSLNKTKQLPVLVWIHGGGMVVGWSDQPGYHPDESFTANMNVVTVTVNYRLNLFGFLSLKELWETGQNPSYGNYGISDLITALKWIKNNIENFGGNVNDVTVFGHSGGGTAVNCLLSSNLARPLFRKAIAASGAPKIGLTYTQANVLNRPFLTAMSCSKSTGNETKYCLRHLDANKVLTYPIFPTFLSYPSDFPYNTENTGLPLEVTDPVIIQQTPGNLPDDASGGEKDILLTYTAQEIARPQFVHNFTALKAEIEPKINSFTKGLYPTILNSYITTTHQWLNRNATADYIWATMLSDIMLSCSTSYMAKNLSKIQNYNIYQGVAVQSLDLKITPLSKYAYHGSDATVLLNQFNLTKNDEKYRANILKFYKKFLHSDIAFLAPYQNKRAIFWNNSILTIDHMYHEKDCEIWKDNGFLKHSWGSGLGN